MRENKPNIFNFPSTQDGVTEAYHKRASIIYDRAKDLLFGEDITVEVRDENSKKLSKQILNLRENLEKSQAKLEVFETIQKKFIKNMQFLVKLNLGFDSIAAHNISQKEFAILNRDVYLKNRGLNHPEFCDQFIQNHPELHQTPIEWGRVFIDEMIDEPTTAAEFDGATQTILLALQKTLKKFGPAYLHASILHENNHFSSIGSDHLRGKIDISGKEHISQHRSGAAIEQSVHSKSQKINIFKHGLNLLKLKFVGESKHSIEQAPIMLGLFLEEGMANYLDSMAEEEYIAKYEPNKKYDQGFKTDYDWASSAIVFLDAQISLENNCKIGTFIGKLFEGRQNLKVMTESYLMIEGYCKGLYPFLRSIPDSKFEIGYRMIKKIFEAKENLKYNNCEFRVQTGILKVKTSNGWDVIN
jgi:hypothetical protein